MRTREVAVFALVVATFSAFGQSPAEPHAEPLPELGTGLSIAAQLHMPLTIDSSGNIGRVTYTLPCQDLVGRTSLGLRLDQSLSRAASLRASLTHERSGFGISITGLAAVIEIVD